MKKYAVVGVILLAILAVGVTLAWSDNAAEAVVPAETNLVVPETDMAVDGEDGAGVLMSAAASDAFNQDPEVAGQTDVVQSSPLFDSPDSTCGANFVDENGDGICDLMGAGEGNGPHGPFAYGYAEGGCGENFVDENGDGVCDLMGTGAGNGPHGSFAYRYAEGGCGEGFVDEDGDGVCDLMGSGQGLGQQGRMNGNSRGGRGGNGAGQ